MEDSSNGEALAPSPPFPPPINAGYDAYTLGLGNLSLTFSLADSISRTVKYSSAYDLHGSLLLKYL